jgi:hypothetical protein
MGAQGTREWQRWSGELVGTKALAERLMQRAAEVEHEHLS